MSELLKLTFEPLLTAIPQPQCKSETSSIEIDKGILRHPHAVDKLWSVKGKPTLQDILIQIHTGKKVNTYCMCQSKKLDNIIWDLQQTEGFHPFKTINALLKKKKKQKAKVAKALPQLSVVIPSLTHCSPLLNHWNPCNPLKSLIRHGVRLYVKPYECVNGNVLSDSAPGNGKRLSRLWTHLKLNCDLLCLNSC